MEQAVIEEPENIEIRFLRYTIQTNIPDFLNYDNLKEDRQFILENLTLQDFLVVDNDLKQRIINYFENEGQLSEEERKQVTKLISGG